MPAVYASISEFLQEQMHNLSNIIVAASTLVMKCHIVIHRDLLVNVVLLAQLVLPASRAVPDLKDPRAPLERKEDL